MVSPQQTAISRLFIQTGLLRRFCQRAHWPLFLVLLITELEIEPLQLMLLGTAMELTILITEIPTGVVADVYSRKWSVVLSFFVMGTAMLLSGLVEPFFALVAVQMLFGFGYTFESGAETAWLTDELGDEDLAGEVILRRASRQLLSGIAGMLIGVAIAALVSLSFAIVVMGSVFIAWGVYLGVRMPETNFTATKGEGLAGLRDMLTSGGAEVRSKPGLMILAATVLVYGVGREVLDRLGVQRLIDLGFPTEVDEIVLVGGLMVTEALLGALILYRLGSSAVGSGVVRPYMLLFAVTTIGVLALAHTEVLAIAALGLILHGGFSSMAGPLQTNWANAFASSSNRATVHSFIGQSEATGEIAGGVLLGIVAQVTSIPVAMSVSAMLFVIAGILSSRGLSIPKQAWTTSPD